MSSRNIQVHVRVRPVLHTDPPSSPNALTVQGNTIKAIGSDGSSVWAYHVDRYYDQTATQEDVFEQIKPLVSQVFQGKNSTIFAYGVTSSGKTTTMQGSLANPGIIPRAVKTIFAQRELDSRIKMEVSFSYVEILCDEVYDLLGDRGTSRRLDLRTDSTGEVIVADLTRRPITSLDEFNLLYKHANLGRKTATTRFNQNSSRSHALLTLHVQTTSYGRGATSRQGKICLIDLAGSENVKLAGNTGKRARESGGINKSLATLKNVIEAINTKAPRVPYRDSKLTRLLQSTLNGQASGLLLCCLAPGENFARDTINTLNFATKTREVEHGFDIYAQEGTAPGARSRLSVASNATGILAPKTNVVAQETAKNPEDKTKPKLLGRPSRGRPTLSGIDRNILVTAPPSVVHLNSNSNEAGTVEHVRAAAGSPLVTEALHMVPREITLDDTADLPVFDMLPQEEPGLILPNVPEPATSTVPAEVVDLELTFQERDRKARDLMTRARAHQQGSLGPGFRALPTGPGVHPRQPETSSSLAIEGVAPPPQLSGLSGSLPSSEIAPGRIKRFRGDGITRRTCVGAEGEGEADEARDGREKKARRVMHDLE